MTLRDLRLNFTKVEFKTISYTPIPVACGDASRCYTWPLRQCMRLIAIYDRRIPLRQTDLYQFSCATVENLTRCDMKVFNGASPVADAAKKELLRRQLSAEKDSP